MTLDPCRIGLEGTVVYGPNRKVLHYEYLVCVPNLGKLRWYVFHNTKRYQPWGVSVDLALMDGLNRFSTKHDAIYHIIYCTRNLLHKANPMLALLADFTELEEEANRP